MQFFFSRSRLVTGCIVLCGAIAVFFITLDPSLAQSWGRGRRIPDTTHLRGIVLVIGAASGFILGWVLSPQAKEFRTILLGLGSAALIIFALLDNGVLGWGLTAFGAILLFVIAFGYWVGEAIRALAQPVYTFGSARWADTADLEANNLFDQAGICLGSFVGTNGEKPVHYRGDRHLITQGPTRSGKGTTTIIPNLLTYDGSMLVIDPKGENALSTAKHRQEAMGQKVYIVDPWNITAATEIESACFNPLDWLVKGDLDIGENAMILADAIIVSDGGDQQFWTEEAKA